MMMSSQLVSIFVMFISGIAVGAVIDCTRYTVRQIPIQFLHRLATIIEWIVWAFLGICTFYFLFLIKGGQWRLVDPLAQIAGIIAYEFIFQKLIRFIGRLIVNILIKPFFYIGHLFVRIVRAIIRWIVKAIVLLNRPILKLFKKYLLKTF
ncbi:hypothetical protein DCE79_00390 [Lysinibacillus sp. 2017]|nr:hypothetical protein DCE79_00390 [Lysinibacillus sp. 2017]TGN33456.1 hypothetical protein E4L99_14175 [Lysinibacillus sp. S2017]